MLTRFLGLLQRKRKGKEKGTMFELFRKYRRALTFKIDPKQVEELLHLPKGYTIYDAEWEKDDTIRLYVTGPNLPPFNGTTVTEAKATLVRKLTGAMRTVYAWEFEPKEKQK